MQAKKIAVVGAGVGGLAAAFGLTRAGFSVKVFERSNTLRLKYERPFWLTGNALRAADALGFGQELRSLIVPIRRYSVRDWQGRLMADLPLHTIERGLGVPTLVSIERSELLRILARRLPEKCLQLDRWCHGFWQEPDYVSPLFMRRTDVEAAGQRHKNGIFQGLVGADGFRSSIRTQLLNEELCPFRHVVWGGVARMTRQDWPLPLFETVTVLGRRQVMTAMAVPERIPESSQRRTSRDRGYEVRWSLSQSDAHMRAWYEGSLHHQVDTKHRFPALAMRLFEATDHPFFARVRDRHPRPRWGAGRVTLLGDAMQPMSPILGQGTGQALESAAALVECLTTHQRIPEAFLAYEMVRRRRLAILVRMARVTEGLVTSRLPEWLLHLGVRGCIPLAVKSTRWILE